MTPPSPAPGADGADAFLDLDGVRLRYRDEGRGPAVLLLHGWTFDLHMWDSQAATLRDAFRVVRLDRRGHGRSGGRPDSVMDASDIMALCGRLGLRQVGLLGMSQGARGALRVAGQQPGLVRALVIDGPPNLDPAAVDEEVPMEEFRLLARRGGLPAFRRAWAQHPLAQLCTEDERLKSRVLGMIERYPGLDVLEDPAPAAPSPLPLESIRAPALVLSGAYDSPTRLQAARHLRDRLPAAQHVVLPDAGHLINLDQPALYTRLCRAFLLDHLATGTPAD